MKIQGAEHLSIVSVQMDELPICLWKNASLPELKLNSQLLIQPSTVLRVHVVKYPNCAKLATRRDDIKKPFQDCKLPSGDVHLYSALKLGASS